MVDRTGLHTAPVPGNPPLGTAPVDGRIVQAALFGSLGQCLNGGGYSASSTTMAFTWNAGVYQIPDTANGGAVYHSPIDSAVLTPAAGQAGGRIDSVYVLQQDYEKNGSTSRVLYGLVAGTPGSGTAPSLSGIAGGPMRLANITVPASATKASDCTVAWIVPPATLALGGPIAANKPLLDLAAGSYFGQLAYAAGITYRWMGATPAWRAWDSDWAVWTPTGAGWNAAGTPTFLWRYRGGEVEVRFNFQISAVGARMTITLPVTAAPIDFGGDVVSNITMTRQGDNYYFGRVFFDTANRVFLDTLQVVTRNGNQVIQELGTDGGKPFVWQAGDNVAGRFTYTPA